MSAAVHAGLFQQRLDRGGHDLRIALVADPALFPAIVEILALAAEMIDEIQRHRMAAEEFRDDLVRCPA